MCLQPDSVVTASYSECRSYWSGETVDIHHSAHSSLHESSRLVHEAIRSVVHDSAVRYRLAKHDDRLEVMLQQVCQEVTDSARRLKAKRRLLDESRH